MQLLPYTSPGEESSHLEDLLDARNRQRKMPNRSSKRARPRLLGRACPAFGEGTPQRDGCIDTDHKRQGIVMTCLAAMRHHHGRESTLTRPGHPDQRYQAAVPLRIPQTARYLIDPYHVRLTLGRGPVPGMEGVEEQTVDSSNSSNNSRQLRQQPWGSRACWSDPR